MNVSWMFGQREETRSGSDHGIHRRMAARVRLLSPLSVAFIPFTSEKQLKHCVFWYVVHPRQSLVGSQPLHTHRHTAPRSDLFLPTHSLWRVQTQHALHFCARLLLPLTAFSDCSASL